MTKKSQRTFVRVFTGPGAGPTSSSSLVSVLTKALPSHTVIAVDAPDVIRRDWHDETALLVFPGGVDRPYIASLGDSGAESIRAFVRDGGAFLGVCAGAYFAAAHCHFICDDGTVLGGPRPLGFFPGTANGPIRTLAPNFDGDDDTTAAIARLELCPSGAESSGVYWGGPEFVTGLGDLAGSGGWRVLARYPGAGGAIAAVDCGHGLGRAVLCGVHPELSITEDANPRVHTADEPSEVLRHLLMAARVA